MALNTLIHVSRDERERAINRSRRMWQSDYESNMNTSREAGYIEGRNEGHREGRNEGRSEGRRDAILIMRKLHHSDEEIAKAYDLSVDAVRRIIEGMAQ
jgi:predicted transposase/invertase (TIGR01784 family)